MSRYKQFSYFHSNFLGEILSEEEQERLAAEFSMLVEDEVIAAPWITGALDLIATYCHRIPLHIASVTPADELLRIVSRLGVRPFFQEVGGCTAVLGRDSPTNYYCRRLRS